MKSIIKISNKDVECVCNAATPILYTEIFKEDFLTNMMSFARYQGKKPEDFTPDDLAFVSRRSVMFTKVAFIFAKQAEFGDDVEKLESLTRSDFLKWLSTFDESNAFTSGEVLSGILQLWLGNSTTLTESKND